MLSSVCCASLSAALGSLVSFPGQLGYNQTEAAYVSLQEANLTPSCIVRPVSAQDVASVVSVVAPKGCRFAIKGHGHSAAAGFANIDGGVTIDMEGLSSLSLNSDRSIVSVGAGAKWLDVFSYLSPYNLQAAGGRNGQVGVGGLLVGGGISHFSAREGFSCDNIVNFQVVLANGRLTNANQTHQADLYRALKGGTNNFAVVTRYDLATFSQGNISVTITTNPIQERQAVFKAFTRIASASAATFDVYTSLAVELYYNSSNAQWVISNEAVYTKPVLHPPIYDELVSISNFSVTSQITSLPVYANSASLPQLYWLYASATFAPSTELMLGIFDIMNETFSSVNPAGGVIWFTHFEMVPSVMLARAAKSGGNVLGLKPQDGNGIVFLISAFWPVGSASAEIDRAGRAAITKTRNLARRKGLLWDYQYLNYAAPYQDVIASYGAGNVAFLKRVSAKYDPGRVFQKQVPGGFKLP